VKYLEVILDTKGVENHTSRKKGKFYISMLEELWVKPGE